MLSGQIAERALCGFFNFFYFISLHYSVEKIFVCVCVCVQYVESTMCTRRTFRSIWDGQKLKLLSSIRMSSESCFFSPKSSKPKNPRTASFPTCCSTSDEARLQWRFYIEHYSSPQTYAALSLHLLWLLNTHWKEMNMLQGL